MNILLIAPESNQSEGIKNAFEEAGHRVVFIHQRINYLVPKFLSQNQFLWRLTIRQFQFLKLKNKNRFNKHILNLCKREHINILFAAPKGSGIRPETLHQLKNLGVKNVGWFTENFYHPLHKKWVEENYRHYDFVFVFDSEAAKDMDARAGGSCRVFYMPMALDPADYAIDEVSGEDQKKYECDVCFVGAKYPEREELLRAVAGLGVKLKIFGWPDWEKSDLAAYYHGPLSISEMAKAYHLSRININCNLWPAKGSVNLKTYEIPASGGFELCDDQRDLYGLFEVGKEIATYDSKEEMVNKIKHYLSHEEERAAVARAGHDRILRDHTLKKRIQQILTSTQ